MTDDDYARLREVITTTLAEGNPFSTVKWDFHSRFDDTGEQERRDFCDVVIARMGNREPWTPGADWTYLRPTSVVLTPETFERARETVFQASRENPDRLPLLKPSQQKGRR